ncbi:Aromatic hydrocarbon utilization transcriptional regulator CatR (LysR family) [Paramagnetospirillum magnetotacticum MS-1]|uniref:Aromatic hydrocarbon utilization transcriptional regulator CatR (LysR family) n=1 Tax=Paramagnetospirillum magnetotacticum MS-1 TaxID=272627 RepID=A0A0C2YFS6_PARME|nr:LysR family transcriptional regulator [Paramagnetospirillum magnetotacticum]KIL98564.1 Aromatic hydrocarbon utilization transcriptional regulator CatR (LysR family) [Paramagnetospirillum magnetotacticum MS-1]
MDLHQLRCFIAVAEELHFGKAAQRLAMLPSALGRHIRMLEEDLGTRLLTRTTRNVALTDDGAVLLDDARALLAQAEAIAKRFRGRGRDRATTLKIGAIDSASAGLIPLLLHDFRQKRPDVVIQLVEDKSIRLLPRLLSGRIDLALVRPPEHPDKSIELLFLFHETAVVAVPEHHSLAEYDKVTVQDLADQPLIVPERRSRPHSHDLTMKLFAEAGLQARVAQLAEEKQTIVNLVAANIGVAIVPRWTSRMAVTGVRYIPLEVTAGGGMNKLPLAAAWVRGTRDPIRDEMLETLRERLGIYAELA